MVTFLVFTNCRIFVLSDTLKEMCVTNIICITQITCNFVNDAMLVNEGRFGLDYRFDVIDDFSAGKPSTKVSPNFPAKSTEISLYGVSRPLIFEWQDNSD